MLVAGAGSACGVIVIIVVIVEATGAAAAAVGSGGNGVDDGTVTAAKGRTMPEGRGTAAGAFNRETVRGHVGEGLPRGEREPRTDARIVLLPVSGVGGELAVGERRERADSRPAVSTELSSASPS